MSDYLPLETWRREFSAHPYHFWGLGNNSSLKVNSACNDLVREYAWQNVQAVGRNEIRESIKIAQERLTKILGYSPVAHFVSETIKYPRYLNPGYDRVGYYGSDARWISIELGEKKLIDVGTEAFSSIDDPVPVFSDEDGDGIYDTFTITFSTTLTDTDEIAVYIPAADRLDGEGVSDRWRVNPVLVSIDTATDTGTVIGKVWQIVRPILYEGVVSSSDAMIDPADTANFCATLEVYRHYTLAGTTNATCQALLIWESRPYPWYASSLVNSSDPAATATAMARASLRDKDNGIIGIGEAVYNATTGVWAGIDNFYYWYHRYPPDRIIVRYRAGVETPDNRMQKLVARLSAAELNRPICACENANRELLHWQTDMSRTGGNNDMSFTITPANDLENPFGTRRGHIYAWKECRTNMKLSSFAI